MRLEIVGVVKPVVWDGKRLYVVLLSSGGGRRCKVVYSYTPQNEDELQLQECDEIEFISEVEEGWWRGRLQDKVGVFPSNFVVELNPTADEQVVSEGEVSAPLSSPEEVFIIFNIFFYFLGIEFEFNKTPHN